MISTPARQAIGMCFVSGPRKSRMSSSTMAWMMPAIGLRPPLLMLVIVRAMAPVTGIPPKIGTMMLAAPWAISSVFESWRSPMTPSATVAESSDSMAPSTAIVKAEGISRLIVSMLKASPSGFGSEALIVKRSPMVSIEVMPACSRRM